jgi:hypothetical protein
MFPAFQRTMMPLISRTSNPASNVTCLSPTLTSLTTYTYVREHLYFLHFFTSMIRPAGHGLKSGSLCLLSINYKNVTTFNHSHTFPLAPEDSQLLSDFQISNGGLRPLPLPLLHQLQTYDVYLVSSSFWLTQKSLFNSLENCNNSMDPMITYTIWTELDLFMVIRSPEGLVFTSMTQRKA